MSEYTNPVAEVNEPDSGYLVTPGEARMTPSLNQLRG